VDIYNSNDKFQSPEGSSLAVILKKAWARLLNLFQSPEGSILAVTPGKDGNTATDEMFQFPEGSILAVTPCPYWVFTNIAFQANSNFALIFRI